MTGDTPLNWLIVEDDPAIREIVELGCELQGHDAFSFPNGRRALEWMETLTEEGVPDVALLDIRMPGGPDGHELAAEMRRHPLLTNIAIILMTAYELPGPQHQEVMTVSGADRLFFKPLPALEELTATVREIIASRNHQ